MSKSKLSIIVFGIYVEILAFLLMVTPNTVLVPFGMAPAEEVWVRVVGVVAGVLGFYYLRAAQVDDKKFYQMTVYGRPAVIVLFTLLVLFGEAEPPLILFGAVDLLAAIWTGWALRMEG